MAADLSITAPNAKQIKRLLKRSPQIAKKHVRRALHRSILLVERNTKKSAFMPIDSGTLEGSWQTNFATRRNEQSARLENLTNYAVPVHEGHREFVWGYETGRFRPAKPFLKDGVKKSQARIDKEFERAVDNINKELTRGTTQ